MTEDQAEVSDATNSHPHGPIIARSLLAYSTDDLREVNHHEHF